MVGVYVIVNSIGNPFVHQNKKRKILVKDMKLDPVSKILLNLIHLKSIGNMIIHHKLFIDEQRKILNLVILYTISDYKI